MFRTTGSCRVYDSGSGRAARVKGGGGGRGVQPSDSYRMEGQRRRRAVVSRTCRRTGRRHFEGERRVKMQSYERTYGSETSGTQPSHCKREASAVSGSVVGDIAPVAPASTSRPCVSCNGFRRAQVCGPANVAHESGKKAARVGSRAHSRTANPDLGLLPAPASKGSAPAPRELTAMLTLTRGSAWRYFIYVQSFAFILWIWTF